MKQIKGEDDYDSQSEEDKESKNQNGTNFVSGSSKFGVKQIQVKNLKTGGSMANEKKLLNNLDVMKAARRVLGGADSDEDSEESNNINDISNQYETEQHKDTKKEESDSLATETKISKSKKGKQLPTEVQFDLNEDLKSFNAEKGRLIKDQDEQGNSRSKDEQDVLRSLFVTQEDMALEDFEKEKDEEVTKSLEKKLPAAKI